MTIAEGFTWREASPGGPWSGPPRAPLVWFGQATDASGGSIIANDEDRAEAARRPAPLRTSFLMRRVALRHWVAGATATPVERVGIGKADLGRPLLRPPLDLFHVSSASRDGWLALAVAPWPVGVDIEVVGPPADPAWAMLHASERARLALQPERDRWDVFLAIWTAKEAYLKAIGLGLGREPSEIAVLADDASTFQVQDCGRIVAARGEWRRRAVGSIMLQLACVVLD